MTLSKFYVPIVEEFVKMLLELRPNSWTKSSQKSQRVFLLAIQSHLFSFALRFLLLQTHATSYNFYWTLYRRKEENLIENHILFPMV
jgi:hypothetical protein